VTLPAPRHGCTRLEEAISARIDGEDPGLDDAVLDTHLRRCASCRSFEAGARALHRRSRVRRANPVPNLSEAIMNAVPDGPSPRPRLTVGKREVRAPGLGVAALVVAAVLVAGFVIGGRLGHHSSSGTGQVAISQIVGSDQQDAAYPGASLMPKSQWVGKPDIYLTDTSGRPYNIAKATKGRVTLLYFGYTHCPNVCPINIGLAAQAIHGLPAAERSKVTMVFVTTDPTRDSPAVIRAWLGKFTSAFPGDPTFVGLTASEAKIHDAERQIHMMLSSAATFEGKNGKTENIVHAGYTEVYSQDGIAHLQVTYAESPFDYTTTLEHLIQKGFVTK
jgi:protein SCO1/2